MRRRAVSAIVAAVALAGMTLGGCSSEPTATPTPTATVSATAETVTPSTVVPSETPPPSETPEPSETPTPSMGPAATALATATPTPTATATPSATTVTSASTPVATQPPPPPALGATANIKGYGYPYELHVAAGTTVTWVNQDPIAHDVAAYDGSFTSPVLAQGQSWSHTFSTPGRYPYFCTLHTYMQALVIVE